MGGRERPLSRVVVFAARRLPVSQAPVPLPAEALPPIRPTVAHPPVRTGTSAPGRLGVGVLLWPLRAPLQAVHFLLGTLTLLGALAVLSTVPVLQLVTLGYLLHVSAHVARRGRLWGWLPGWRQAACWGWVLLALGVSALPLFLGGTLLENSYWIAPESPARAQLQRLMAAGVWIYLGGWLLLGLLVCWLRRGTFAQVRDHLWRLLFHHLPRLGCLGLRGWLGAALWLALPVTVLVLGASLGVERRSEEALNQGLLVSLIGSILLGWVALRLVVMQTRFAVTNRFGEFFRPREARRWFARAPLAWLVAVVFTLGLALPLYLFKIAVVPQDAAWLPGVLFILMALPGRWLSGWAWYRSRQAPGPRHWFWRHGARVLLVPAAFFYVLIVFFSQYAVWHGIWGLYEQHAFLLPIPTVAY